MRAMTRACLVLCFSALGMTTKLEAAMDPRELDARLLEEKDPRRVVEVMRAACGAPCAYVPFVKGPLDEAAWALAEPLPFRFIVGGGNTPTQRTEVRLAADARFLHVAFRCWEDDLDGLVALAEERDGGVWSDDCVEVFLDARGEPKDPRTYLHFIANSLGVLYDARGRDEGWDSTARVAVRKGEGCWTAEFTIPLAELAGDLKSAPLIWAANFARTRQGRQTAKGVAFHEETAWSPTGGRSVHVPAKFGRIFLEVARQARTGAFLPAPPAAVRPPDPLKALGSPTRLVAALRSEFGGPALFVPKLPRPLTIDGNLGKLEWRLSPAFQFGSLDGSGAEPTQLTLGRLLCDGERLYLAFECFEESPRHIVANCRQHDGPVWEDDEVEVFLEPAHQHSPRYFHIAVNGLGTTYDARGRRDASWNPRMEVKAVVGADRWVVEMALPFSELGLAPGEVPALWGANFIRMRPARADAAGEESAWSPTLARTAHRPSRFGHIYLESGSRFPSLEGQPRAFAPVRERPPLVGLPCEVWSSEEQARLKLRRMTLDHMAAISEKLWAANNRRMSEADTVAKWERLKQELRAKFWESLGGMPQEKCPLLVRRVPGPKGDGWEVERVIYQSRPGFFVTGNLYRPTGRAGPFPAILRLIGHSTAGKQSRGVISMHVELACKGYLTLAIDSLGQGERMEHGHGYGEGSPTSNHYGIGARAFLVGANLAGYMVWDAMRGVDLLLELPEVDKGRVAVTGESGGGTLSGYVGALDERIAVVVPVSAGGSPHFGSNYDAEQNLLGRYRDGFDWQALCALCAPRPLKVIRETGGALDAPEPSIENARRIYALYGAADRIEELKTHEPHGYGGGHQRPAFQWLDRWLKVAPDSRHGTPRPLDANDLLTTLSGMLYYSPEFASQETVLTLTRRLATRAMSFPEDGSRAAEHQRAVVAKLTELLAIEPGTPLGPQSKEPARWGEHVVERISFQTDPGVFVSCLVLRPSGAARPRKAAVWVYERDRRSLLRERSREMLALLDAGWLICIPNVRGTGESAPEGSYTFLNDETSQNCGGFEIARPLIGFRVKDVLCTLAYLRGRSDVRADHLVLVGDSLAERNPALIPGKRQVVSPGPSVLHQGESLGAYLAVMAAALDGRVRAVAANGPLLSWLSLFDDLYFYHQNNLWVPHVLRHFDFADLCAALAPRPVLLLNPADGLNRRADPAAVAIEFRRARASYQALGNGPGLQVEHDQPAARLAQWLTSLQ